MRQYKGVSARFATKNTASSTFTLLEKYPVERILFLRALIHTPAARLKLGSGKLESGGQDKYGGFSLASSTELLIVDYWSKGWEN